ncbi:hypothetical protein TGAM01_v206488 [Trichoderma gamsii]|uniref:Thymidylate kinase n=1 Tax=Trichoderma gamsii TaxID=398673 RepID=A0A0W7VZZ2_9HYPO|nr:hypothetical protein TGAM01_v206488 [Trichoderma gamsii]PNP44345.1 hypothetical protein TGAMA5MH_03951 [Trichoderma gamsii]PON24558.1 hypothetical protein TGAM01_v206488 [Trichoderma gamsii]
MAAVTRQPFAPLDGARLQSLTSLKNRQNAAPVSPKRKAELLEIDNCENVDPLLFSKRSKGVSSKDALKPSNFFLTPKVSTPARSSAPVKAASTPRRILSAKSCLSKLGSENATPKSCPPPAGRSPTHGKRSKMLSSRRRTTRLDPPSFMGSSSAPFSLDAALKGTIAGYTPKPSARKPMSSLLEPESKSSWFFDIHEDTPEQEMTNLLQHSTCTLDISSDEETEQRAKRDGAEGRDKENIPPPDDVSQTSAQPASQPKGEEMVIEKERVALGEMNAADFYADGCDDSSVILIHEDDEEPEAPLAAISNIPEEEEEEVETEVEEEDEPELEIHEDIDALISRSDDSSKAAVLQPIEGTGESFELWESDSAKDAGSPCGSP